MRIMSIAATMRTPEFIDYLFVTSFLYSDLEPFLVNKESSDEITAKVKEITLRRFKHQYKDIDFDWDAAEMVLFNVCVYSHEED